MGVRDRMENRIAAWRTYRGYTQLALARKVGVTDKTVRGWEAGRSVPDGSHLAMLCAALRCRRGDLFPGC